MKFLFFHTSFGDFFQPCLNFSIPPPLVSTTPSNRDKKSTHSWQIFRFKFCSSICLKVQCSIKFWHGLLESSDSSSPWFWLSFCPWLCLTVCFPERTDFNDWFLTSSNNYISYFKRGRRYARHHKNTAQTDDKLTFNSPYW